MWITVLTLALANALPAMTVATLGIVLPEVRGALGLSEVQGGALFSVLFVAASLSSLLGGRLADRAGRFVVLVTGMTLLSSTALLALADGYAAALVLLAVAGVGYGLSTVALYALLSDLLPTRRGLGTGLLSVTYGTGALVGPLLAGAATAVSGWRAAFLALGALGLAMIALPLAVRRRTSPGPGGNRHPAAPASSARRLDRDVALVTAAAFFGGVLFWATSSWAPTVLRVDKALTLGQAALAMAAWGAMPMVGSVLVGMLSDRLGRRLVMLSIALPGALAVVGIYTLLHSAPALAAGFALLGLIRSPIPSQVVALGQDSARSHATAAASGLVMSAYYAAAVVAPLVTGAVIAALRSGVHAMVIVVPVGLLAYGALIAAVRERRDVLRS